MRHLGNFKDWVKPHILDKILTTDGQVRPGAEENESSKQQYNEWNLTEAAGAKFYFYSKFEEMHDIELPINNSGNLNWWFVKLNPTYTFPLHQDTFKDDSGSVRRLWIPYQDYIPGHIFIYKDFFIKDYKAGDIFEFDDPLALHGSANLSSIPKVSLQIVEYV
jgi:hypothetical protein